MHREPVCGINILLNKLDNLVALYLDRVSVAVKLKLLYGENLRFSLFYDCVF